MRLHPSTKTAINTIIHKFKPRPPDRNDKEEKKFTIHLDTYMDISMREEMATTPDPFQLPEVMPLYKEEMYYYAVLMLNHTIVAIFKDNSDIYVRPMDINMLVNFMRLCPQETVNDRKPFYEDMCLPGMTEDYKLPVLVTFCPVTDLKILYVCEER